MSPNEPTPLLDTLKTQLPPDWQPVVDELAAALLPTDRPLRLSLLGAFSVGKSTLLNGLLGEPLLPAACEETTALPTFIEYGPERAMQLVGTDGSVLPLDDAGLARAATEAPEGAACAVVRLPLDWLRGVSIIDLPGLGGMSSRHREYTLAQVQQADVILYLIAPRGPDAADLDTLRQVARYSKRIKCLVARWDEVETAAARGEPRPSLEQWAGQIESGSGLRARLAPVDRSGLGHAEIRDFIGRARDERGAIRLQRFCAELRPRLENALGLNAEEQRVCERRSEEETRALQSDLLQRRQVLTEVKGQVYAQAEQDRAALETRGEALVQQARDGLDRALAALGEAVRQEADWEPFALGGADALRDALAGVARGLCDLSAAYGDLELPEAQVTALDLRLPPVEPIEADDFLDLGRLTQLQGELESRQAEQTGHELVLANLPVPEAGEQERALRELWQEREQLVAQPLPRIVRRVEGGGPALGRMLGEICDIGLLFVNPAVAGAKVASLVGRGAKIAGIAANTGRIAKVATTTVKVAQGTQIAKRMSGVPPEAIDKLAALEVLSLGYWGERIGTAIGGPREETMVDPEALAQQQAALAEIEERANELRRQIARCDDLANERRLAGWALEQNRKEQAHLQSRLVDLTRQAETRQRDCARVALSERQQLLHRHLEHALTQWRRSFDRQTDAMRDLLRVQARGFWEERVAALVSERLSEVEALSVRLAAAPEERAAALAQLQNQAEGLRGALALLEPY
jgi:hypothetical protein